MIISIAASLDIIGFMIFHTISELFDNIEAIAFEHCNDGFTPHGGCTTITRDGAIGAESINSVLLNNGYLDFGARSGCPFDLNSCQNGFNYYGWVKLFSYPSNCSGYGVITSSNQFNIHILGNGHLAVYVWMDNDREWYTETIQPIMLKIWYPIIVQFFYNKTSQKGSLQVVLQNQLSDVQNCSWSRTYKPPSKNFLFGGDGTSNYANVQLDRINLDGPVRPLQDLFGTLFDPNARQGNCLGKSYAVLTRPFTCYWLEDTSTNWSMSYDACNVTTYNAGYPYGRLATFPSDNTTVWGIVAKSIAHAGNGSNGYLAWLGGGNQGQWLNKQMTPVSDITFPPNVQNISTTGSNNNSTCMALNTRKNPWQWVDMDCNSKDVKKRLCQMSWDCLIVNPCKNFGVCIPVTDGALCTCLKGTSGQYCEEGVAVPTCVNDCNCTIKRNSQCDVSTTTTSTAVPNTTTSSSTTTPATVCGTTSMPTTAPTNSTCSDIFQKIVNDQINFRRLLQGFMGENDIQYECNFAKRSKLEFETFLRQQYETTNTTASPTNFKKLMYIKLYQTILENYIQAIKRSKVQVQLLEHINNSLTEITRQTEETMAHPCANEDYVEHCREMTKAKWNPFLDSLKMKSDADEDEDELAEDAQ